MIPGPAALAEAAAAPNARAAAVALLKPLFETAREKAGQKLDAGGKGVEVARLYSAAADEMLTALWSLTTEHLYPSPNPTEAERLSLLAVGGYGRGVLAPFSDLDLLFLRPWKSTARSETVTEFMLYVLWDLGLKVGQATRSIDECLKLARADMTIRTTLLEARFIVGDRALAEDMIGRFQAEVSRADPRAFIAAKLQERDTRQARSGAVRYRVEPNVKDGKGGLRDLNTLFWIARSLAPESPLGARVMDPLLTPRERRTFEEAFDFLWSVRCHLHRIAGRAEEKLTFDIQAEVARRMGWRGRGDEPAVERFMRRYFVVARDVGALTRAMSAKLEAMNHKPTLSLSRLLPKRRKPLGVEGFIEDQGRLSVTGPDVFQDDPVKLLQLFVVADRNDLDLHPDAFSAVTRSLSLVTPKLRRDADAARAFLDVLAHGHRPYRVLTIMNETGLLGRFLPEWGRIVGQTQFNMYHAYTVDEHTLQAIGLINDFVRGKLKADHPLASKIIHQISDPEVLFLAMLLHDVGKGGDRGQLEDGAFAALRACDRLGLSPRRAELVAWLVRHHLSFSDYAQKRDPSDPATVAAFAALVGDPERLRMLVVLTVADIRAVGPGVWNNWKGQLMRELYQRTEAFFRGEEHKEGGESFDETELVGRVRAEGAAVLTGGDGVAAEVTLGTVDRPGLFADIAAVMAAAGADVTGARVRTTADGVALDVFHLQDGAGKPFGEAEPRRLQTLVRTLKAVATGEEAPPEPPRRAPHRAGPFDILPVVMLDARASETALVIEVSAGDRPGLLADLARTLAGLSLSVRSAHVAGFGARAVDVFYVTEQDGAKPSGRRHAAIRKAVLKTLEHDLPPPASNRLRISARDVSELGVEEPV